MIGATAASAATNAVSPLAQISIGRFTVTALSDGYADMPFGYFPGRTSEQVVAHDGTRDEEVSMLHKWLQIASTPSVKAARERYGSAAQYARLDGTQDEDGPVRNDRLGPAEAAFIAERDGFYLASVSETGWPYVQFRGGPAAFLRSSTSARSATRICAGTVSMSPRATSP